MDVYAEHAVAGIIGLLANGIFSADYIIGLDGVNTGIISGGWLNQNYKQLYIQVAYIVSAMSYAFVMSAIIAFLINLVPGLHLRASEEAELMGMDDDQLGEFAYDYVEVRRDFLAWTPAHPEPIDGVAEISESDRHGISGHKDFFTKNSNSSHGDDHSPIIGDRHGQAAEKTFHPGMFNSGT